ncbi:hypothetical protein RQP46_005074 [Phenoliferia psychrophenolica]
MPRHLLTTVLRTRTRSYPSTFKVYCYLPKQRVVQIERTFLARTADQVIVGSFVGSLIGMLALPRWYGD